MCLLLSAALFFMSAVAASDRIMFSPGLRNGQTLHYDNFARIERNAQTESNVASMLKPAPNRRDLSLGLTLSIEEIRRVNNRPMLAAQTALLPGSDAATGAASLKTSTVSFTIAGDGSLTRADGLDDLEPEFRLAWQFWVSQFAFVWTLPTSGVKPGDKWKSVEEEKTPAALAGLEWDRETNYVQNDFCPVRPQEQCAIFLTSATLRQKSSSKDATPEDFRLHSLKTSGAAKGTNQTIAYINLKTGLLMRATEDLQQSMDVTILKSDGSNGVHYQIDVASRFETVYVPEPPK